jgi:GntR family transcriptional repressor for pyruvate dehydrogenase complex
MSQQVIYTTLVKDSPSEQIFKQLKSLIDTQVWKPGYKIPSESQLAAEYGVSRMTIRSATQRLKALGLLDVRQGNGSYVIQPTLDSIIKNANSNMLFPSILADAYSLRYYLEQAAVDFAIQNASDAEIDHLEVLLNEYLDCVNSGSDGYLDADISFHRYIYIIGGNQLLLSIFNMTEPILRKQIDNYDSTKSSEELKAGRIDFHTKLFNCIKSKNLITVFELMQWYRQAKAECM